MRGLDLAGFSRGRTGQPPKSFDDSEDNPDDPREPSPLLDQISERAMVGLVRPGAVGSGSGAVASSDDLDATVPGRPTLLIVRPTRFELVPSAPTAKTIGLALLPTILLRADHVIE
jgi:hypothetical protein